MIGKVYITRYPELTFQEIEKGIWRIFSKWDDENKFACTGPVYRSKSELLCDLERFARECGL